MSVEGNLHGYVIKALDILREAKRRIEKGRPDELADEDGLDYKVHADLCNAILLLREIEKLNDEEVALLRELLSQEHAEEEELGRLLAD